MTHPEHYGMVTPTLTLTAYDKDSKEIGTVRASTIGMTFKPNPEGEQKPSRKRTTPGMPQPARTARFSKSRCRR
jgi:hypothetical protein